MVQKGSTTAAFFWTLKMFSAEPFSWVIAQNHIERFLDGTWGGIVQNHLLGFYAKPFFLLENQLKVLAKTIKNS